MKSAWKAIVCGLIIGVGSMGGGSLNFCEPLMAETHEPTFDLSTTILDGDIYIKIEPYDPDDAIVEVNGSTLNVHQFNADDNYYYRVSYSGEYKVEVTNSAGQTVRRFIDVQLDEKPPTLELSRVYMNDKWYIHIEAKDDYELEAIYVGDEGIAFDDEGDAGNYEVTESKSYVVTAEDKMGNKTSEEIYVDVEQKQDEPELKLSKEYMEDSWYLVIEAKDGYGIEVVKVNGEKIDFGSKSDRKYYKVNNTDSYHVEVTNIDGHKVEQYLYINIKDKVSIAPEIALKQVDKADGTYLTIEAKDNGKIVSVQVEGKDIPYDAEKQLAECAIHKAGVYHVTVKDDEGNEVKDFISIEELADIKTAQHTVIFTVDSKVWKKDGVDQNPLDIEPKIINNRMYIPIRYVAEAMGIQKENILWNNQEQKVVVQDGQVNIFMPLNENYIEVDNRKIEIPAPAIMNESRIMIPLSSIPLIFKQKQAQYTWDNQTKQIEVRYIE